MTEGKVSEKQKIKTRQTNKASNYMHTLSTIRSLQVVVNIIYRISAQMSEFENETG